LNETVDGMLKMLWHLIGENIDLIWKPACDLYPVKMDPAQIDQILANLLVNARDAISGVGRITIETGNAVFDETYFTSHMDFIPGDYVMLAVSDNGCGMDSETLANIFEPFFTTKELYRGGGLGMATVYGIVKQNKGFINVYSEPGSGTVLKIYLPRYVDSEKLVSSKDVEEKPKGGNETVLIVEDEVILLEMARTMLERLGYNVLAAVTPGEALRLARDYAGGINLLITDVVMPEMNGHDLAGQMISLYPDIKCLFMSGYTANAIAHHGVLSKEAPFIQKPFSRKDLAIKLREALEHNGG
jgi:CheY-like chemotaxis protein